MSTLMLYRDTFTSLGYSPKDKHNPAPHAFALLTESDGTTTVFCEECDTDSYNATHCCKHNMGAYQSVCSECEKSDWYLDLCEAYWESRMEGAY